MKTALELLGPAGSCVCDNCKIATLELVALRAQEEAFEMAATLAMEHRCVNTAAAIRALAKESTK